MPERAGVTAQDWVEEASESTSERAVRAAAFWLARTHHHDWRLLDDEAQRGRLRSVAAQMHPVIDALLHLSVEDRMEVMGMRPGVIADWGKGQHLWIEDESKW